MGEGLNGHRRPRWWPAALAGLTALVVAALGIATAVGVSLLPASWTWAHNRAVVWIVVGALLVLAVVLAMTGASRDSALVVTGSGPVFVGPAAPAGPGRPPASPDSPGQVLAGEIPARPAAFLERTAAAELASAWDSGQRVAVVQAITGGPGVGKTQAAAAYARGRAAEGWPLVAWVAAETPDQLLAGLTIVAVAVGVADENGDSAVSARNVRRYLETSPGPALMVFDNATDVDGLAGLLPTVGAAQVVITSRDRAFTRLGLTVDVGPFTAGQSVAYLTERTGLADTGAAAGVAAELGYLPLALAQAATVISQQSLDYATYQRRLHQAPVTRYLPRHAGDPYPRGAGEAIALAVRNVEDQDDSGLTRLVMSVLSVLSSEGVDRFVLAGLADTRITAEPSMVSPRVAAEDMDRALGRLVTGSILTRSATGQALSMHRLVSRVVRERDQADGRLPSTLRAATDLLAGLEVPRDEAWPHRQAGSHLVEQVSAVWAASSALADSGDPQAREITGRLISLRNWSVRQLTAAADLSRAVSLGAVVLADCERLLGSDHAGTLDARANLALAYAAAGRLREAIPLLERNLADRQRILGAGHPGTLDVRHDLAEAYRGAGRLREAIGLLELNLADRERVLGADHPDTLASRHNLAFAYLRLARRNQGISLLERNLADRERLLGADHPDVLTSRHSLALAYLSAYRRGQGISLLERNLADRERVLGADHPDTLTARDGLASAYRQAHRRRQAITLYERSLADRERLLGRDHPETLAARDSLARAFWSAGRFRTAIVLARQNATEAGRVLEPGLDRMGYRASWFVMLFLLLAPGLLVAGTVGLALAGHRQGASVVVAIVLVLALIFIVLSGLERLFALLPWDPPRLP